MAKRTSEDIQREIDQLKNRKKEVLAQEKNRARKLRTKRLIERGAILEQYIEDAEHYTNDEVREIVKYALNTPYAREYIRKLRATSGFCIKSLSIRRAHLYTTASQWYRALSEGNQRRYVPPLAMPDGMFYF